jgi:hypothetical protein
VFPGLRERDKNFLTRNVGGFERIIEGEKKNEKKIQMLENEVGGD